MSDPEIEAEEARLNRIMAKGGNPVKIIPALGGANLKPAVTTDKSQPKVGNVHNQLVGEIKSSEPTLKHAEVNDKSKPQVGGATVKKNVHGQLFNEIKTDQKPALKHTEVVDKSKPVIESVQLRKTERPQLFNDIKEAGGTQGLQARENEQDPVFVKTGSAALKAKQFEKEIADHNKSQEKPQKKTVWAPKNGQNNYGKKVVYAKPEGGPPPKKTLAELL